MRADDERSATPRRRASRARRSAFARLTALNFRSLWTVDRLRHPDLAAALTAFVAAHRPMPFEQMAFALEPGAALDASSA